MKKSTVILLAVVAVVIVVSAVGVAFISGMLGAFFNDTEQQPEILEASITTTFGGGYDLAAGAYELEGTAENLGDKDAKNVTVDVTFFNADTQEVLKNYTVSFGDINANSQKDINISIEFPSDSVRVTFSADDPVWE